MAQNVSKKAQTSKPKAKRSKPKTGVTIIVFTPEKKSNTAKKAVKTKPAKPVSKKGKTK